MITFFLIVCGGLMYGVVINSMDVGKAEHLPGGGFWRNQSSSMEGIIQAHLDGQHQSTDGPVGTPIWPLLGSRAAAARAAVLGFGRGRKTPASASAVGDSSSSSGAVAFPASDGLFAAGAAASPARARRARGLPAAGSAELLAVYGLESGGGVEVEEAARPFRCVDGGRTWLKLTLANVNDDYCDCEDGSDEPGTSACSNGRFACRPARATAAAAVRAAGWGGEGAWEGVPSSRVGDGVCDCCGGADEWHTGAPCDAGC